MNTSQENEDQRGAGVFHQDVATNLQPLKTRKYPLPSRDYYRILSMFPDVDARYIKETCQMLRENEYENKKEYMTHLIEYLLQTGLDHPRQRVHDTEMVHSVINLLDYLADVFPDANVDYLQEQAGAMYNDPQKVENFVREKLETQDYPTNTDKTEESLVANEVPFPHEIPQDDNIDVVKSEEPIIQFEPSEDYYKVLSMFPEVEPSYIRQTWKMFKDKGYSIEEQMNKLIDYLLNTGTEHLRTIYIDEAISDVNELHKYLLGIFVDADSDYLLEQAKEMNQNSDRLKEFIQTTLENPSYPTRKQYLKKDKKEEELQQYITNFNIQKFLEIFPDPFSHFENKERKCKFERDAFEFLKFFFKQIKVSTINLFYWKNKYNLALTTRALENCKADLQEERFCTTLQKTDNMLFIQEMVFIIHRDDIKNYFLKIDEETAQFVMLKERNELLECQCCFENEYMSSQFLCCDDGHIFCVDCIQRGVGIALADGQTRIACFAKCDGEISLPVLQKVLSPAKFNILLQKRQEAEILAAKLDGLVSCPFCYFASIPPMGDKIFKCFNPDCMKESCRLCKGPNHIPFKCDEVDADKLRHLLEEKMTEALIRPCYSCKKPFFKEEGCNLMVCSCGAKMCYICDKMVDGYSHFRGQGSTDIDLCPLWSDNQYINAKTVHVVAEEVQKEIKKRNPAMQIDTELLLPQLPHKSSGPHEHILHADVLPERAYKIPKDDNL